MLHVTIVGGGIAGLSAAIMLCEIPNIQINIYEKEKQIGGQASSKYNGKCYSEYSWRVFGSSYLNLLYLFKKLDIIKNFDVLKHSCFIDKDTSYSAELSFYNQIITLLKKSDLSDIEKLLSLLLQSKERLINDYKDVNLLEYFNDNPVVKAIVGPFLGMDAKKVSLSGALKNLLSVQSVSKTGDTLISKYPTQESMFDEWEKFLINKGVHIYKNRTLDDIYVKNNEISHLIIDKQMVKSDDYIFACSITPLLRIINRHESLRSIKTLSNLNYLKDSLQLYFTVNLYFSEKLTKDKNCSEMVILDMPWQPIIQKKRLWSNRYMNKCKGIKDIWNVGFLDFFPGKYNNKILSECSIKEAVKEGIKQIKYSKFIKKLITQTGKKFDDLYVGNDYWYQFIEHKGKLITKNPKFSINTGTMKYMPNTHNDDLPINMYLAGYYVNSSMGGVSMEASCETGLNAGKYIINKYKLSYNDILPIRHEHTEFFSFFKPFHLFDKILYKNGLQPITNCTNSIFLIIIYIVCIIILIKKVKDKIEKKIINQ
jgi:uncharacterized protein with NAD-binding domain and iron-sulfur cluster